MITCNGREAKSKPIVKLQHQYTVNS